jgi:TetR/AcrR family fatty acid metabolism transcriptional regulator
MNDFTDRQIEIMEAATNRIDKFGIQELTIKNLAADLNLSEAALYRHFKSKNDILLGLLTYFILEMNERIDKIINDKDEVENNLDNKEKHSSELLKRIFNSQLSTFVKKPAIVSVIFSEGIFQFNKELSEKVSAMMNLMQKNINVLIIKGQNDGVYGKLIGHNSITTIIMGSMRMVVLKWKLSGNKSNLVNDGKKVLNGILKMIEKK